MGVHGLWRLIEPSGKPVPLETLENKVLAVDVSIWLHQAVKGFQDAKGASLPNAHLLGIYHRVCKLLYFRIKPVFVFDGGVPALKRQTIAKRNQLKSHNSSEAERLQKELLSALLKHTALSKVLSEKTKASITAHKKQVGKHDNLYALLPTDLDTALSSSEDEDESDTTDSSPTKQWDLHTIDMTSADFKSLPVEVRHEILTELRETRKQNSWGRLHQMPKQSDDFATYQMKRLLKRQAVQAALDEAANEMGGMSLSLAELESLLKDQGIPTTTDNIGKRIASDENTRYLFIKDIKQAMEIAKRKEQSRNDLADNNEISNTDETSKTKADLEEEDELQKAIQLSLQETTTTTEVKNNIEKVEFSFLEKFNDEDFESDSNEEEYEPKKTFASAQSYMLEYSGLTPSEIAKIISNKSKKKSTKMDTMKQSKSHGKPPENLESESSYFKSFNNITSNNKPVEDQVAEQNYSLLTGTVSAKKNIETISDGDESKNFKEISSVEAPKKEVKIALNTESTGVKLDRNISGDLPTETIITSNHEIIGDDLEKREKSINNATAEKNEVETISEESEDSNDFLEISHVESPKNTMEIVIDPTKTIEDDDLFGDIFVDNLELDTKDTSVKNVETLENKELNPKKDEGVKIVLETLKEGQVEHNSRNLKTTELVQHLEADELDPSVLKDDEQSIKNKSSTDTTENLVQPKLSVEEMRELKDSIQQERTEMLVEKATKERMASNITDQMYQEAQELLELFGMPYVIAPMEAEAQCAFLDEIELTDGTITDDSDVWLFGGRTVYKNFFNQSKYVMEFNAENIKHNFKLTREQMILLALLVGSDYTTGLQGVGPVTALEILAAFPPPGSNEFSLSQAQLTSGLKEFRSWFNKGKSAGPGRATLKSKLKNISFTDNFPSLQVVQAYLEPKVETSKDKFSWGKPDVVALTIFAKEKFGWSSRKVEEILNPVIKRLEENRTQKSIKDFFKTKYKLDSRAAEEKMSKRVKTAIGRFGKTQEELIEEMKELARENRKKTRKKKSEDEVGETKSKAKKSRKSLNKEVGVSETNGIAASEKSDSENKESNTRKKVGRKASDKIIEVVHTKTLDPVDVAKPGRGKKNSDGVKKQKCKNSGNAVASSTKIEEVDDLKQYENLAVELKKRRQMKNELDKTKIVIDRKQKQKTRTKQVENIPKELAEDEEIQFLMATESMSSKRVEAIEQEAKQDLEQRPSKRSISSLHTKDVIHQRLRDKTDLLRNKMKAIEVFRKSKKGPGFLERRRMVKKAPKEDAGLSEDSE